MKRGAQYAASWSGTALLGLVVMFAASPAAVAAPASPSVTSSPSVEASPSVDSSATPSGGSTGSEDSESSAPENSDPDSAAPGSTDPETPGSTEPATPDPSETPAEPTPTPDPSAPTTPEPSTPGTPDPSEDPTQLPEEPSPTEPSATPAPGSESPAGEHYLRCGSAFAGPGETEALRLDMSRGITDLSAGSSLTGAAISIQDGVVYYEAPSPLPPGSSQDDFSVRGQAPDGTRVQTRCYVGLQESPDEGADSGAPAPSTLSPTRAAQTEETPDAAPSAPDSSVPGSATPGSPTSRATLGGPPIPGMPGYPLPELNSAETEAASEAADSSEPATGAADPEGEALAQTGLDTLRVSTAVALALLAIIAGAAALLLASRRVRSAE